MHTAFSLRNCHDHNRFAIDETPKQQEPCPHGRPEWSTTLCQWPSHQAPTLNYWTQRAASPLIEPRIATQPRAHSQARDPVDGVHKQNKTQSLIGRRASQRASFHLSGSSVKRFPSFLLLHPTSSPRSFRRPCLLIDCRILPKRALRPPAMLFKLPGD